MLRMKGKNCRRCSWTTCLMGWDLTGTIQDPKGWRGNQQKTQKMDKPSLKNAARKISNTCILSMHKWIHTSERWEATNLCLLKSAHWFILFMAPVCSSYSEFYVSLKSSLLPVSSLFSTYSHSGMTHSIKFNVYVIPEINSESRHN